VRASSSSSALLSSLCQVFYKMLSYQKDWVVGVGVGGGGVLNLSLEVLLKIPQLLMSGSHFTDSCRSMKF